MPHATPTERRRAYLDVVGSEHDPAADDKAEINESGTDEEAKDRGRRTLDRHQQNLQGQAG